MMATPPNLIFIDLYCSDDFPIFCKLIIVVVVLYFNF